MKRLATAVTLLPSAALAHPGDHHTTGLWHVLTEPDHLAMIAAVVAVLGYAVYKLKSRS
jgi:hydrogenase/urease accessory protein HupE